MPLAMPLQRAATLNPFGVGFALPTHGFWAEDPKWTKPADGAAVASVRNNSGGGDPAQATGAAQPLYAQAVAALNGRAALLFDGVDDYLDVDITDLAQPFQIVSVFKLNSLAAAGRIVGRGATATSNGIGFSSSSGLWTSTWATTVSGGAANTSPHVRRDVINGASSSFDIDGTQNAAGNVGSIGPARLTIGAGNDGTTRANFWAGYIAFLGIYPSTTDLAALIVALRGYYGTA